jgi:hypothetical protein
LYNITVDFGVPVKLVRPINMCSNETYVIVRIGKDLSNNFLIQNSLKEGDALSPLLFNFALVCAFRRVQKSQVGLKLNRTHQLLVYADDVSLLGDHIYTIKKPTIILIYASKEVNLEANAENTKCMCTLLSRHQNVGQNLDIKIANKCLEMCHSSNIWKRQ